MSYYFCIVGTRDQPLFELEFGTSKQGGDGIARFSQEARHMNPFIVHSSLDLVDEMQWTNNQMYLKRVDQFASSHISTFLTPTSTRFMLLHLPHPPNTAPQSTPSPNSFPPFTPYTSTPPSTTTGSRGSSSSSSTSIPNNPASPQTEEAIRAFFAEVFEAWTKAIMSPFASVEGRLGSPVFRQRVAAAGRKYL
ncbi:TRAPP subunit [Mycoblastus sanguinarius]|nr:TRAPP subunit [Mycoblastus sanguinarius]